MPYIADKELRKQIDGIIEDLFHGRSMYNLEHRITKPGTLNYAITRILTKYTQEMGLSYATINEVMGVLECAKQEFYGRVAIPYEEKKHSENGDVYPPELVGGKDETHTT